MERFDRCQETIARDLEDRKRIPANQRGFRPGQCTLDNAAAFAYDLYEGFQWKEQTLAIDLEDAYNRVRFKLLMDLLLQHGVSLTLHDPVLKLKELCVTYS